MILRTLSIYFVSELVCYQRPSSLLILSHTFSALYLLHVTIPLVLHIIWPLSSNSNHAT
ncbi:hypothetical protein CPB83DRAFT_844157 [Crepidotus variabilis]|uniref:Uncharacterized protein n=1 Tax=Crepidotus variabilis TaxID=179855 RepID=A0A9P6EQT5_9AGAR|nr:hypothetical protein CPB83DRAFT_844157 [Crepidotus variabilis]